MDYVLHQAALGSVPRSLDDPITSNANIEGFLNTLVAARDARVRSFTDATSSPTYGDIQACRRQLWACPDLDATLLFDRDEIRGTYLLTKGKQPPEPPTINDVLRLIATLGGFLARKGDGEPGVENIDRGCSAPGTRRSRSSRCAMRRTMRIVFNGTGPRLCGDIS